LLRREALAYSNTPYSGFNALSFDPTTDLGSLKQTFVDEFNRLSLQSEGGTWRTSFHANGTGRSLPSNGEEQIYMDPAYKGLGVNPFSVSDGVLNIHAARSSERVEAATGYDYTSGMISSKSAFAQTYGYFEIKCELPAGKGAWPAFWLLPADSSWPPELDVFEVLGDNPSKVYLNVHSKGHRGSGSAAVVDDLSDGMHTFGVLWSKTTIIWYVDGEEVFHAPTPPDMHKPMYMISNLAIGGYWPGSPDASFTSMDMKIDYIKAYSLDKSGTTPDPDPDPTPGPGPGPTPNPNPGPGADVFNVGAPGTKVYDTHLGDGDLVNASISYTLPGKIENLTLTGGGNLRGTGNGQDNILYGNSGNNVLRGLGGDDILDGRGGSDRMAGGKGDDTYFVRSHGDRVVELAGQGRDTVHATVDYSLGATVEALVLEGGAVRGHGNNGANAITGNNASNYLSGGGGADTLLGNGGNDLLVGGSGADTMRGGAGNDSYSVDNRGDKVGESAGAGFDTVNSSISYTLTQNVERLTLVGNGHVNGTGNSLDNNILGNGGNNVLKGGAGDDIFNGNGGHDFVFGGSGSDTFVFNGEGTMKVADFGMGGETDRLVINQQADDCRIYESGGATHVQLAGGGEVVLQGVDQDDLGISGNVFYI
jgi:beta-glucanase (GH16 family)